MPKKVKNTLIQYIVVQDTIVSLILVSVILPTSAYISSSVLESIRGCTAYTQLPVKFTNLPYTL